MISRQHALSALRAEIAAIENRPALADTAPMGFEDGLGLLATAPGLLHEMFTDTSRNAGALLGFALGQAKRFLSPARPALMFMQLQHEGQETGIPYGPGLAHFGLDPDSLVLVRTPNVVDLLWALEEAIACQAVAGVVADIGGHPKALDFTATRRLSLRAAAASTSAFLLRYGPIRNASAAQWRWSINPQKSGAAPFDPRAPGPTRWQVVLEKSSGNRMRTGGTLVLGWAENGFVESTDQDGGGRAGAAAPFGAAPAALGHRLPRTA